MQIQFPDLTEFLSEYSISNNGGVEACCTEFAFVLLAFASTTQLAQMKWAGLTPVSCMNNWWPTHRGETRPLTLCFGRVPKPQILDPIQVIRKKWGFSCDPYDDYESTEQHLAASGCGLKIGELPFHKKLFHRYFTLMRLPVTTTPVQERWLKANNYRFLDKGTLASYWVNGWPVDEWAAAKEYAYFKTTRIEWGNEGLPKRVAPNLVPPGVQNGNR